MSFADHSAAIFRQLQKRRKTKPNMRLAFDYKSRKGVKKIKHAKHKQLTAKEIAQLRFYIDEAKRNKRKYQIIALLISVVLLVAVVFLFLELFEYVRNRPDEFFSYPKRGIK